MSTLYANDFNDILFVVSDNDALRGNILNLINNEPMPGKVTEGGSRLSTFREIMRSLVEGQISLPQAYHRTETELPRSTSIYRDNNRVFAAGWAERLVRTQLSRFYNQAVMEELLAEGQTQCFVPHSSAEAPDSPCSLQLAGANHNLRMLYDRLVRSYREGIWVTDVKIPNHPHCTHVVTPAR